MELQQLLLMRHDGDCTPRPSQGAAVAHASYGGTCILALPFCSSVTWAPVVTSGACVNTTVPLMRSAVYCLKVAAQLVTMWTTMQQTRHEVQLSGLAIIPQYW